MSKPPFKSRTTTLRACDYLVDFDLRPDSKIDYDQFVVIKSKFTSESANKWPFQMNGDPYCEDAGVV